MNILLYINAYLKLFVFNTWSIIEWPYRYYRINTTSRELFEFCHECAESQKDKDTIVRLAYAHNKAMKSSFYFLLTYNPDVYIYEQKQADKIADRIRRLGGF